MNTFKSVYDFITRQFKITDTFSATSDINKHIKELINLNYQEVLQLGNDWSNEAKGYIPTVVNQSEYALPNDLVRINSFNDKDFYKIKQISRDQYDEYTAGGGTTVSDRIQYYMIRNGKINLFPTPSMISTLTMFYKKAVPTLTLGTNTLLIKEGYEKLIPLKTMVDLYDYREEHQSAVRYEERFERMFRKYKDECAGASNHILISRGSTANYDPNRFPSVIS